MKVSLVTSVPLNRPWDQGDKNFAYALARAMSQHTFEVLTDRHAPPPPGANLARRPLFRSARPSLKEKAEVYVDFWRRQNGTPADLYHFIYRPYPLSSWLARLVPAFRQQPTIHTVAATAGPDRMARSLFFARCVVAQSRHGKRKLEALGVDNVRHIPAAIHVRSWAAVARRAERAKAELGLEDHLAVLFPGHYGPGYGAGTLLEALPRILRAVPQARFIFACRPRTAGDTRREEEARRQLREASLSHAVRFFNTVDDMKRLIAATDLTVLPLQTMHDKVDIPTTLLESLAAARPVIVSDLAPMNELFEEGEGPVGRLTPPGDAPALAEAIIELLNDAFLRCQMGARGQTMMFRRYDMAAVAKQYDELYRTIRL
jgi:glycosyltransferase involved in cell wall biosynthesis